MTAIVGERDDREDHGDEGTKKLPQPCGEEAEVVAGGGEDRVDRVADRKGHDLRYSVDISKIQQELCYEPLVPFEQGLAEVVQWYRDRRDWWEPLKDRAAL